MKTENYIEMALLTGWKRVGGLWESPYTRNQWAWDDDQMAKHMMKIIVLE